MPQTVIRHLSFTYQILALAEEKQDALKWLKIARMGSNVVLQVAADRLDRAPDAVKAETRQKLRNEAMALMVGFYVVPRPADFQRFRFGESVFFNEERGAYTFVYLQQKIGQRVPIRRTVHLPPSRNYYFDAVILRDARPDLLPTLRAKAMHDKRMLTIHDNGDPVAYGWYSRVFTDVIGTGGHAMRAIRATEIIQAHPNAIGVEVARKTLKRRGRQAEAAGVTVVMV